MSLLQQPLDVTNHSVAREVVTFFTLPPGDYIVVPQTNVPNCDGKFLLRILTDEQSNIWEVNEDNMLFRNVLAEFEESFKYVSRVTEFQNPQKSSLLIALMHWVIGISCCCCVTAATKQKITLCQMQITSF